MFSYVSSHQIIIQMYPQTGLLLLLVKSGIWFIGEEQKVEQNASRSRGMRQTKLKNLLSFVYTL